MTTNEVTTLGCGAFDEVLLDDAAGQSTDARRAELTEHLSCCSLCTTAREQLASVETWLTGEGDDPTARVEDAVMSIVSRDLAAPSWWSSLGIGAAIAAAAVLVAALRIDLAAVAVLPLFACTTVWVGAFALAAHHIRRGRTTAVITALPLAAAAVLLCPFPSEASVCAACEGLPGGFATTTPPLIFAVVGAMLGGGLGWIVTRALPASSSVMPVVAIATVVGAMAPALYLAGASFSAFALLTVVVGLAFGAAVSAVGVSRRRPATG